MAPKVNKPAKISAKSEPSIPGPISTGLGPQVDATFPINKAIALQLPLELLLEIVTYFNTFPSEPVGFYDRLYFDREASSYLERTDALRSLSQTCRPWRNIFLPLLWERLDVLATHSESGAWYQVFGETLIRKCFLVTENRGIASHVRSMSVVLSRYSTSTVLPAFVRGIEALPNLKTLCIATAHDKMTTALKTALDGHVFSQIETAMLPTYAHNILSSCPEVKKVVCVDFMDASKLISAIAKCCKKVEEIERFTFDGERQMRRLVEAAPNLRSIKFQRSIDVAILKPLAALKSLSHITLQSSCTTFEDALNHSSEMACVKAAKDILKQSKFDGPKSLVLEYYSSIYFRTHDQRMWSERIDL